MEHNIANKLSNLMQEKCYSTFSFLEKEKKTKEKKKEKKEEAKLYTNSYKVLVYKVQKK